MNLCRYFVCNILRQFTTDIHLLKFGNKNKFFLLTVLALGCMASGVASHATPIVIPNGDFSSATNANPGSPIGGGLLNPSAQNVAIGTTGPWTGSYTGSLGVLAPPTLQIDSSTQKATIGGLVGINLLGSLVFNSASFNQILASGPADNLYRANKIYTLSVNVDTTTVLGANQVNDAIIGSALTSTSGAATTTVAQSDVNPSTLNLLSTGHYQLLLPFTTPASGGAIGERIGVSLFSQPHNMLSLSLNRPGFRGGSNS